MERMASAAEADRGRLHILKNRLSEAVFLRSSHTSRMRDGARSSRRKAVEDALSHPEWSLPESMRHLKRTMRLTTAEMAKFSGVAYRTMQDIEQQRSEGSVQTMNRIFGMPGLTLAVARIARESRTRTAGENDADMR